MLVEITLPFDFFSTYTMRLIPVQFGLTQPSGLQPDQRNTFQLPPPAFSINLSQPCEVTNGLAYGNGLDLRYFSNNVEVHEASLIALPRGEGNRAAIGARDEPPGHERDLARAVAGRLYPDDRRSASDA